WLPVAQRLCQEDEAGRLTPCFLASVLRGQVHNALLEFKGETRPVIGRGGDDDILQALPDDLPHQAVLHRTVMGVITTALQASEQGQKIYWVGGIEAYNLRHLGHVFWLSKNRKEHIQDEAFTRQYEHFADYVEQAKATGDAEMRRSLMLLKVYNDIPQRLAALEQQTVKEEAEASITVTTVHRAKGLEWDNVALFYDFPDIFELEETPDQQDDELNLLYVGVTRAIKRLALNASVESILRHIIDRRRQKNDQSDSPVFSN
ncbi:3'-5' exonuclease, partial [Azomonas macrocytogenes]|uniref:3'-5' exonuclease n=1 Tax=Azomonas macrocytogenes TaxID=69962 RepID=UPI001C860DEC